MTRWKRGGKPGGVGRGHLHNIPFIHGTKQTSTESLLRLEVGSTGKGRNRWGVGVSLKKIQAPPKLGCLGGTWSASTPEESEDQKQFGKARTVRGEGRKKVQGVGGLFGNWVKGLPSPCWDPPSPSGLAGRGQPATPTGRSLAARCSRQGAGGGSQRLALQGDDSTAPQLLCHSVALLDLLLAVCL